MKNKINKIKSFSSKELSQKLLKQIISHQDLKAIINEFNNKSYYSFDDSLRFQLGRSMVKHCSPADAINWKNGVREKEVINDDPNNSSNIETINIINDFLNAESRKSMERIKRYQVRNFNGKTYQNAPFYNFSIVCAEGQFENYSSWLFNKENHEILISYYLDYISRFPITLNEFEEIFFYFLTFLTKRVYPANVQIINSHRFIEDINKIVKMRYIDIEDTLILAFIYFISIDDELQESCSAIYNDTKYNNDLTIEQLANLAS